jgi:preprotein translocase subunit SecE
MATKAAVERREERPMMQQRPNILTEIVGWVRDKWQEFARFLSDVRAEMRKVVAPTWKEVKTTTAVVIVAVFIFGAFFFVVDGIFKQAVHELLKRTGGLQQ